MNSERFPRADEWVQQFDKTDQETARAMLGLIHFVTSADLQAWINSGIEQIRCAILDGPLALYAIREVERDAVYLPLDPAMRPEAAPGADIGSEGATARILRDINDPSRQVFSHPSIEVLRTNRVHDIVFVDDTAGSGRRTQKFIQAFYAHPTIKSWVSVGLLRFHIVAYVSTPRAEQYIISQCDIASLRLKRKYYAISKGGHPCVRHKKRTSPASSTIHFVANANAFPRIASVDRIKELCQKYGRRHSLPSNYWLGFRKSFTLVVYDHGCPNTAPAILWAQTDTWNALFPGRKVDLPHGYRVSSYDWLPFESESGRNIQSGLLKELARGVRNIDHLSRCTGYSKDDIRSALRVLRDHDLITPRGRLTTAGAKTARALQPVRTSKLIDISTYLPSQLRGPNGAF